MSLGLQAAVAKASESERLFFGSAASKVVEEGVMGLSSSSSRHAQHSKKSGSH